MHVGFILCISFTLDKNDNRTGFTSTVRAEGLSGRFHFQVLRVTLLASFEEKV